MGLRVRGRSGRAWRLRGELVGAGFFGQGGNGGGAAKGFFFLRCGEIGKLLREGEDESEIGRAHV